MDLSELLLELKLFFPQLLSCFESLLLDGFVLEPDNFVDPFADLLILLGFLCLFQAKPGCGLVNQVDRLVRKKTVGDIPARQNDSGVDRVVRNPDAMMLLVLLADSFQNEDCIRRARFVHHDLLETSGKRGILFDVLPVLVNRRGADNLHLSLGHKRLQYVRRVHCTFRVSRTDDRVKLVDEQDDISGVPGFFECLLKPVFEFTSVFGTRDHTRDIERYQSLSLQDIRNGIRYDHLCKALGDRRFTDTGFADQDGVILGAAGQNLHDPVDFGLTADNRIEFALFGQHRQITRIFVECGRLTLSGPRLAPVFAGCGITRLHIAAKVRIVFLRAFESIVTVHIHIFFREIFRILGLV